MGKKTLLWYSLEEARITFGFLHVAASLVTMVGLVIDDLIESWGFSSANRVWGFLSCLQAGVSYALIVMFGLWQSNFFLCRVVSTFYDRPVHSETSQHKRLVYASPRIKGLGFWEFRSLASQRRLYLRCILRVVGFGGDSPTISITDR